MDRYCELNKKLLFVSGTRADFGKLKSLMKAVDQSGEFECFIFATGMHLLKEYGLTVGEIYKSGFKNVFEYINQISGEKMELSLANTITGLSRYVEEYQPDLIITHGDRVETLASAIVGLLRGVLVAHVEGGERTGSIDESLRHAVSKLAHIHFVSNEASANRLKQLGENPETIYIIGSPDLDVMFSEHLPSLKTVKSYYNITFDHYAILIFHPVPTELDTLSEQAKNVVDAVLASQKNVIAIYPNNDQGRDKILNEYHRLHGHPRFRLFPSIRFESFLSLLKQAEFVIGNSSAGIHEAPACHIPTINIGTRQHSRFSYQSIITVPSQQSDILSAIERIKHYKSTAICRHFGQGNSHEHFMAALRTEHFWNTPKQKVFNDIPLTLLK